MKFKRTTNPEPVNLLDLKPRQNVQWEANADLIVLLVPRFSGGYLGRWFMRHLKRPNFRLKLDDIGSFIWQHCDGGTTIQQIGEKLKERFGESVEPLYARIERFIRKLHQENLLIIDVDACRTVSTQGADAVE